MFLKLILIFLTLPFSAFSQELLDLSNPSNEDAPKYLHNDSGKIITDVKPQDVIHWDASSANADAKGLVKVGLRLRTDQDFTIYTTKLTFIPPKGFTLEDFKAPKTTSLVDPIEKKTVEVYTAGEFEINLRSIDGSIPDDVELAIKYVGCTRVICLFPFTEKLHLKVFKNTSDLAAPSDIGEIKAGTNAPPMKEASLESKLARQLEEKNLSFSLILLFAFIGGLLTNLTPCVAPMLPITVRVLAKQSKHPLYNSISYASGLMATYTVLGVIAAWSASLFGGFIAHPLVAGTFAVFMHAFGLSMIGFGNWTRFQQIGNKFGSGKESLLNTFFMGSGAGLVAAPCTGPVLASILTYTATTMNMAQSAIILAIYSFGFALPYVFLGQIAHRATQFKVKPRTQIATKLIFSSIMFALGFYYLRLLLYPLLILIKPHFLTLSVVFLTIGLTGILFVIAAKHLHHKKAYFILPTVLFGFGLFSGSQFLTSTQDTSITWNFGENVALNAARVAGKPLLIDAWAEWCEACKKMEATTFADPIVQEYLKKKWVLGKIDLTEQDQASEALQSKYAIIGLPSLILLPADGNIEKKQILAGFLDVATLMSKLQKYEQENK